MENKITLRNCIRHFKTICKHKYYVFKYCKQVGLIWRGLVHDLSKFSPTEFFESVKYYTGTKSPIDTCKELNGYSKAWMHHKGRNTHHYEYWQDNFDKGTDHVIMPFNDALEMLCDYLGAGKAYSGKDFTFRDELKWYENKRETANAMNPVIKEFMYIMLYILANFESFKFTRELAKKVYDKLLSIYKLPAEDLLDRGISTVLLGNNEYILIEVETLNDNIKTTYISLRHTFNNDMGN